MSKEKLFYAFTDLTVVSGYSGEPVAKKLKKLDYVEEVYEISGNIDIRVMLRANSIDQLNSYLDKIKKIDHVCSTDTKIVLKKH